METLRKSKNYQLIARVFPYCLASIWLSSFFTPPAHANMIGHSTQTFTPSSGSQDFATVQSSRTVRKQNFNLGIFVNHAGDTLPYESERQRKTSNTLTSMDLSVGYGLTQDFEFGLIAPFALSQTVRDESTHSEFLANGNTEVRPYVKYKVLETAPFGLGVQANMNINRVVDNPYAGEGSYLSGSMELVADWAFDPIRLALNLGYRYQPKGVEIADALVAPVGDRYLASIGIGYQVTNSSHIISEVYGSKPVKAFANRSDRKPENLESLLGFQYGFSERTKGQIGATSEILHGLNSADWRIYVGINQLFGPEKVSKPKTQVTKTPQIVTPHLQSPSQQVSVGESKVAATRNEPREIRPSQVPLSAPVETFVLRDVHFEFDSDYQILKGGLNELQRIGDKLYTLDHDLIVVEGHCDYFGTEEYNDDLSIRRAKNVARNLIRKQGLNVDKIHFVGFGERKPKVKNRSDFGRQLNRRVEIKVYKNGTLHLSSK